MIVNCLSCFVCESEMALESSVVGEGAVSGMSVCVCVCECVYVLV